MEAQKDQWNEMPFFGGKISNFASKEEKAREDKHLKAYLQGHRLYRFGYKIEKNENGFIKSKVVNWLPVLRSPTKIL